MRYGSTIATVECFPLTLPLSKPLVMATYRVDEAQVLYVRVRTDDGAEGWGEAAPNAVMSGETLRGMVAAMDEWIRPSLVGKPMFACRQALASALRYTYANGGVKGAVDMALLDLEGNVLQVPAVTLLGGAVRSAVRVLRLVGSSNDLRENVDEVESLKSNGFSAFKLKVGLNRLSQDVETLQLLRSRLGAAVLLGADANMGWDLRTARMFTQQVAGQDLAFLEQPLAPDAIMQSAELARSTAVPIIADESIHGVPDIIHQWTCKAVSGVGLKANKLGGVSAVVRAATVCEALGLSVNLAMMMESSLSSAALVHAACAVPSLEWGLVLGCLSLAVDPVERPLACVDGEVALPLGSGLGVKPDLSVLRSFGARL